MTNTCTCTDISTLEIAMDSWTKPFWDATAKQMLTLPACADCQQFRWPPGPFCPSCLSQNVEWRPAGAGRIYSFTLIPSQTPDATAQAPALIEFPQANGVRLLAAMMDTPLEAIVIGKPVEPVWRQAANAIVPGFRVAE